MTSADRAIASARRRLLASRLLMLALDAIALASIVFVVLSALDATSPLAPLARAILGPVVVAGVLVLLVFRAARARASLLGVATMVERALDLPANPFVNALQLSPDPEGSPVTEWCVRSAHRSADELAPRAARAPIVDRKGLGRASFRGALGAGALAGLLIVAPRVASSAWERFTDPYGGHPPYSRTEFVISHEPDPVLVTQDAIVRIETALLVPEALELVLEPSGERIALDRAGDEPVFHATLRRLTEPVSFYASGSTGRSRVHTITPLDRPIVVRASVHTADADGNDGEPVEIATVGSPTVVRPSLGGRVVLRAEATVPLGPSDATAGSSAVEAIHSGPTVECAVEITESEPFDLTLSPVSLSGLASEPPVIVRVEPRPARPASHGAPDARTGEGDPGPDRSGDAEEQSESERMLERAQEKIAQMTPESAVSDAEQLVREIDEVLSAEPESASDEAAQETLREMRESLEMVAQGVPGAVERMRQEASERAQEREAGEEPSPELDPTRASEDEDRDRLVIDPGASQGEDEGPEPGRLEGDTLIVEPAAGGPPVRIELGAAMRDFYASLGERDRAVVARYFRRLAQQEADGR